MWDRRPPYWCRHRLHLQLTSLEGIICLRGYPLLADKRERAKSNTALQSRDNYLSSSLVLTRMRNSVLLISPNWYIRHLEHGVSTDSTRLAFPCLRFPITHLTSQSKPFRDALICEVNGSTDHTIDLRDWDRPTVVRMLELFY